MDRDSCAPFHAIRLLRPDEVGNEPVSRRVGAHHDCFAAESLRLADDALGRLARAEDVAVGLDAALLEQPDGFGDAVALVLPLLPVWTQARGGQREADTVDPCDRKDVDRNL